VKISDNGEEMKEDWSYWLWRV